MGIGKINNFKSEKINYSTPVKLFEFLNKEFNFNLDVCALPENAKCKTYFSPKDDGLSKDWKDSCWMNPPFNKDLKKWVLKAQSESKKHNSIVCCLVPFRGNTVWFRDVCMDCEIRFIIGEVNFNDLDRGFVVTNVLYDFWNTK